MTGFNTYAATVSATPVNHVFPGQRTVDRVARIHNANVRAIEAWMLHVHSRINAIENAQHDAATIQALTQRVCELERRLRELEADGNGEKG